MAKKKQQGHYCRICGERKANERFSGKGHAVHICKACGSLPIARRNELERINRVSGIAEKLRPTKEQWDLLEKYAKSRNYPELREYAADVLEYHRRMKEARKPTIEETPYSDLEEELKEELEELLYDDIYFFIMEKEVIPEGKRLEKIKKGICEAYVRHYFLRILPDDAWEEKVKEVLSRVIADVEEEAMLDGMDMDLDKLDF